MPGFEDYWFNKAEALTIQAEEIVSKALRQAGWKHTSQTPGSYWMWEGEIDGRRCLLSQDDAARVQEHRDRTAYFEQYPDELND